MSDSDAETLRMTDDWKATVAARTQVLQNALSPLPGSIPYNNIRPINVSGRFDGCTIGEVMSISHPHISAEQWKQTFAAGRIRDGQSVVESDHRVRGGEQYQHYFPNTLEPDVNSKLRIVYEDESLVAIDKPAPLPMHPSGRYNRNTLMHFLSQTYETKLRPVQRLDANTTGLVLLSKSAQAASELAHQFQNSSVGKVYWVACWGHPTNDSFVCDQPISEQVGPQGRRRIDCDGKPARTEFRVVRRLTNGTSLLTANPRTGRTNQIRLHLWSLGIPIHGDPLYLRESKRGQTQTLHMADPPMKLHAAELFFLHPTQNARVRLSASTPAWWR